MKLTAPGKERIAQAARKRIEAATTQIQKTVTDINKGRPLDAEPDRARAVNRIATRLGVGDAIAGQILNYQPPASLGLTGETRRKAEFIQGATVDYVGVAWFDAGRRASNTVARIAFADGSPLGTGFLVSNRLLLTNNHVIPSPDLASQLVVEFKYEIELGQSAPTPVRFALDPNTFFQTDDQDSLDFTLIALGNPLTPGASTALFGACPLSTSSSKHALAEVANIIQHPDGDYKQIIVRENRILHRGDTVLHYVADTEPGASGSPVFNDDWQVIAIHHWGEPHREVSAGGRQLRTDVNEGIRISAIVNELNNRASRMNDAQRRLLQDACTAPRIPDIGSRVVSVNPAPGPQAILTAPATRESAGAPASRIDRQYANRRGYNEHFLPGFPVPMPQLNAAQIREAARVRGAGTTSNPYELKYEHFSVILNADRRMAFFSICNIDGSKRIRVDRDSGLATSGPEATEVWATDPRVPDEAQLSDAFYARLRRDLRTPNDFFARGHLTRREDPNWGQAEPAQRANNDTYHHTNACPQVNNAFNASQRAWQGIENYVLNSADDSNLRVTVITGPVFTSEDPVYEDEEFGSIPIPQQFWKIVARVEDGQPIVFAILADQSEAMDALMRSRREALWDWPRRLSTEYRSTVAEIATLTGLDFGNLARYDVFAHDGAESRSFPIRNAATLFPRRYRNGDGFGRFPSISEFLGRWEEKSREGAERRRTRKVIEVTARVARVFADDLSGAKHQQFTVVPLTWIDGTAAAHEEVEEAIHHGIEVRIAIRFGDSMGLPDRIPEIQTGVELKVKGEWISASDAYDVGGEDIPVLHFTHDPLGFVCTPAKCYS